MTHPGASQTISFAKSHVVLILADLKHERTRAVQPPLWPEEETKAAD
jgi:hypothetical protein